MFNCNYRMDHGQALQRPPQILTWQKMAPIYKLQAVQNLLFQHAIILVNSIKVNDTSQL